jgi:hypothetical protein
MFAAHAGILFLPIVEDLFVDADFTTDVVNRSADFFFFEGFYYLTLGISAFIHLIGKIPGFLPYFIQYAF